MIFGALYEDVDDLFSADNGDFFIFYFFVDNFDGFICFFCIFKSGSFDGCIRVSIGIDCIGGHIFIGDNNFSEDVYLRLGSQGMY